MMDVSGSIPYTLPSYIALASQTLTVGPTLPG